ncbi:MAG: phage antirepressor KilAC domain-containing protein [Bacillota bacterium]|jgi:anti-repressor protein
MADIMNIKGIECYEKDGMAYLKLETVARGLGFTQIAKSGNEVIRWERINKYLSEFGVPTCGDEGFIPENIFYRLAMKAKNKTAEKFQAMVADEVMPSIRRHGAYMTAGTIDKVLQDPDFGIRLLSELKTEREQRKQLELDNLKKDQLIGELKPKADYTDIILQSKALVTITQIAKDYGMSGKQMNKILHQFGVQYNQSGQWLLYAKYHSLGYTHSETIYFQHTDGKPDTKMNTKWTQKGRLFIYELLKKNHILPLIEQDLTA